MDGRAGARRRWIARRGPALLENVGDSIAAPTAVSAVAGAVGGATLLVLYGYLAYGHLLGWRLPVERTDVAAGLGVALFLLGLELLARPARGLRCRPDHVPGHREFEPVEISG